ncbi:RDD family protein [Mycolicibacter arupensis]|uniref:Membrane protein n=1 Tax=Mycolicibacter arupensis TaxID=342002 RepID=A0A0F5MVQ2_9MYCO|nr:RDD family protein [Mycolicibacter arupensis]KKB98893.1 membrane protein [Mycolicibacter arupensis]MCV7276722.1 RDD family protein [Mycolicibacter arupensis]OQZ96547.1 RDD family protein [Mycolicibacter arupensis]TXI59452.1 MAG: RDD family protein [Mycolicibacter arupensis]
MSRTFSSWLSGPESAGPRPSDSAPGQRLGLPESGPGSLAPMGRRMVALALDWMVGYGLAGLGVAAGLVTPEYLATVVLGVWLVLGVAAVRLFGFTPGQYACGLRVVPVDGPGLGVGLGRATVRGLMIALVVPALFADADGRGLQDRATATAVVRSR